MSDGVVKIRDQATLAVGGLLSIDGSRVRTALWVRASDEDPSTRFEAIFGLARRRDRQVWPLVGDALEAGEGGWLMLEAAAYLADPRLLRSIRARNPEESFYTEAVAASDPDEVSKWVVFQEAFLNELHLTLASTQFAGQASLLCDLFTMGTTVVVGLHHTWVLEQLVEVEPTIRGSCALVLAELEG
jgi:hypothetical protein